MKTGPGEGAGQIKAEAQPPTIVYKRSRDPSSRQKDPDKES